MTPKEIVLGGYQSFAEGDMEALGKIFHKDALIKVNGNHELSGEYHGFDDFLANFLAQIPIKFPNFNLDILNVRYPERNCRRRQGSCQGTLHSGQFRCAVSSYVRRKRWVGNRVRYIRRFAKNGIGLEWMTLVY